MRDSHAAHERLGFRGDKLLERLFAPPHESLWWRLLLWPLTGFLTGSYLCLRLRALLCVFDLVLGGECDHVTFGVETRTTRAARDLVELTRSEPAHFHPVKLCEGGDHNGSNRHVNTHTESVGATDDFE